MKIAVIAANGRAGKAFVARALREGHDIRAGVMGVSSLAPHPRLEVLRCDATDPEASAGLIAGCDAVASFIGHVKGSPATVQTDAARVVTGAMKTAGLRRIVSLTGTGVRVPGDRIGPVDRLLNFAVGIMDPDRVRDGIDHAAVLQSSGFDWTILRVLKLQNFRSRPFELRESGPTRWFVNRDEVAGAALDVLREKRFIRAAPILSKP